MLDVDEPRLKRQGCVGFKYHRKNEFRESVQQKVAPVWFRIPKALPVSTLLLPQYQTLVQERLN